MARTVKRDLTRQQQLARGPVDLPYLGLVLILLGIGLVMLLSSSSYVASIEKTSNYDGAYYFKRQAAFAAMGLVIMYFVSKFDYQRLRGISVFVLGIAILLLIAVLIPHVGITHNRATRWLKIGVEFQPSEVAKIGVVLFFAARLCKRDTEKHKRYKNRTFLGRLYNLLDRIGFIELVPYIVILGIVAGLVVFQTHLSGALLILAGGASVLFAAGIHLGWFITGGVLVLLLGVVVIALNPYMLARIQLWQGTWEDLAYQTRQSLIAMGSGGFLGRGLGNSMQKMLYIPEPENDFVFPIVVEELGFLGGLLVLVLFALLILRGYWLALHARDKFGALTVVGIITLFAVQVFLNIGVVTNLIPNTGISLPFFSYGGTALMIQLAEMGMVLSISRQIRAPKND